jgi:hypothetical protein
LKGEGERLMNKKLKKKSKSSWVSLTNLRPEIKSYKEKT